jgi:hypothetical protein
MAEANVKNLEALEVFQNAITTLRDGGRKQVDDIREQLQRISSWLEKELPDYWRNEHRLAEKRWVEAREELLRCQAKSRADEEMSCGVERKKLALATERRQLCEERLKILPKCAREWNQMLLDVQTDLRYLEDLTESSLLLASQRLSELIETLRKYLST